jgi:hypothetical protein
LVEKEKLSGKRIFKIFFFTASACAGKKNMHSAVYNGTVSCFFFLTVIETHLGNNPKMGYDSYPLLYNSYGAKTLRSKLVKKTKGKKMV